jgi:hypothetical protein
MRKALAQDFNKTERMAIIAQAFFHDLSTRRGNNAAKKTEKMRIM